MEAITKFFSEADLKAYVVAVLMVLVCAVPFSSVISEIWNSHFKKGE